MNRFFRAVAALAAVVLAAGPAGAQVAVPAQNPAPVAVIDFSGGYRADFEADSASESYFRFSYNGRLIREKGTPLKQARSLDLAAPVDSAGAGDRPQLEFRLEGGTSDVGGGLFDAAGAQPLALRGIEALNLRGTARVAGDLDGDRIQMSLGVETPPFRVPGFAGTEWSNWFVLGAAGHRQEGSGEDGSLGLATYRGFVGKAFGWRKSADPSELAAHLYDLMRAEAPTYDSAGPVIARLRAIPANQRTNLQQLLLDAYDDTGADGDWLATLRDISFGEADARTDQPTLAFYAESSGWYSVFGEFEGDSEFRNLLTATLDYWFLPSSDDVLLRTRYEYGFERATPSLLKNQLLVSLTFRL
jgi:hypothetical protein